MNKLKVGDRVQLKAKNHSWYTEHMIEMYENPGTHEFKRANYEEIAMILLSKARRTKLKGVVINYGAGDDEFKGKRKFVRVQFFYKDMTTDFYVSEKDVKKLA